MKKSRITNPSFSEELRTTKISFSFYTKREIKEKKIEIPYNVKELTVKTWRKVKNAFFVFLPSEPNQRRWIGEISDNRLHFINEFGEDLPKVYLSDHKYNEVIQQIKNLLKEEGTLFFVSKNKQNPLKPKGFISI